MPDRHRPRILIDALAYHPRDGGFTTSLHHLLETCAQLPEFEFVVAHHRRYRGDFARFGLATYEVRFPSRLRFLASLVLLPWIVRRARADGVHCECSALPRGLGVPGIVTVHDLHFLVEPGTGGTGPLQRLFTALYWRGIYLRSLRRARLVKAVSAATAEDVRRRVDPALPLVTIPHRVLSPDPPAPPREWPRDGDPVRLLFLGSIVPRRNLPFLLRALPLLHGDWRLDVVGNFWWGTGALGSLAQDSRVTLHGYVSDEQRDRFLRESHVLVAPSVYEGFGLPVVEAMSHGMLTLTSDIPAFRDYVPDECRFSLDDPARLAELYNRLDAATYARLTAACTATAARFSPEAHVEGHRRLFAALAAEPRPAPGAGFAATVRGRIRRVLAAVFGERAGLAVHRGYHRARRTLGRFGPAEDAQTLAALAAFVAGSRTVLDVGANVGAFSHFFARRMPREATLYTFEPNAYASQLLRSNVPSAPNVQHLAVALAEADGVARLHVPRDTSGNPASALGWLEPAQDRERAGSDQPVRVRSLDALVRDETIRVVPPAFIKIDVEGGEAAVLRGAHTLLRDARPVLYFECEQRHLDRSGSDATTIWELLAAAGYRVFVCRDGRASPARALQAGVTNYLAVPDLDGWPEADTDVARLAEAWRNRFA